MEDVLGIYKQGNLLFKQAKYEQAIKCYENCLDIDSSNTYMFLEIAMSYFMLKDYDNALENFSNYIDYSDYIDNNVYSYISYCHYKNKNYIEAVETYNEQFDQDSSISSNPHEMQLKPLNKIVDDGVTYMAKILIELANLSLEEEDYKSALQFYTDASDFDSDISQKYKNEINKLKIIVNTLNKADEYFEKGNSEYNSQNYEKAIEYYEKSLEFNPNIDLVHLNKADAYYQLKKYDTALDCYTTYINKTNKLDDYIYFRLAYCNRKQGNNDKALEYYTKAIELNPNDSSSYNNRALIYEDKEEFNLALKDFDKAIEIKPDEILYRTNRASLYKNLNNYDSALEEYLFLMDLSDYDEPEEYLKNIDECYENGVDKEKVLEGYEKYFEYYDQIDEDALVKSANLYKKIKNYEKAIEKYNILIENLEDNIEYYKERANVLFFYCKDYSRALQDYNIIVEYYNDTKCDNSVVYEFQAKRGECYKELEVFDLAIADLSEAINALKQVRLYKLRAQVYENTGEVESAISDYMQVVNNTESNKEKSYCQNKVDDLRNINNKQIYIEDCTMSEILSIQGFNSVKATKFFKLKKEKSWYKLEHFAKDFGLFNPQFMTSKDAKRLVFPSKPIVEYGKRKIDF